MGQSMLHSRDALPAAPVLVPSARDLPWPSSRPAERGPVVKYRALESQGDPFTGSLVAANLGPVRVSHIVAASQALAFPRGADRPRYDPRIHSAGQKIVFQLQGVAEIRQGGICVSLQPGSWTVHDTSRPYGIFNDQPFEQLALLLPKDLRSPQIERALKGVPEEAEQLVGLARVLCETARAALSEAEQLGQASREGLGDGLLELAKLALVERLGGIQRIPIRETFRERVERFIIRNLADQELSIEAIAKAFDCSKRYLHKVFSESGSTVSTFIWDHRLDRCRRDLIDPANADRSITEIAFNWGFVNSTHFSRTFRSRYGKSPRDYRREALERACASLIEEPLAS